VEHKVSQAVQDSSTYVDTETSMDDGGNETGKLAIAAVTTLAATSAVI